MTTPRHALSPALQLTGSTTLLPRMQRIAEAYMETHPVRVVVNDGCGTARGYKALLDGTTDIAMASGTAPDELAAAADARGLPFRATAVRRDAIVPVVHASNPLDALSLQQLRNVFTGRIGEWHLLGGPRAPIEVLVGPPTGGVSTSWRQRLLGADDTYTPLARVLGTDDRLARMAARPFGITYAPHARLPPQLKVLRIADAAPDGPVYAPLMLVTLGPWTLPAARFIAYAAAMGANDA
ncbi:substrate-binding domain-containing protein [Massilia pinisoli]|uniref:Substrate-binding domain-containing protein n=1 Tax=Massilia pinisoli TaxID=1772194 RepID=A0ABT1ZKR6_9BURK|nr:substrate-binding domain-containing protein [Massilia pinisoli]MCS0580470.1 substrate-binding domain-containing protein [Massilia pinisoli]